MSAILSKKALLDIAQYLTHVSRYLTEVSGLLPDPSDIPASPPKKVFPASPPKKVLPEELAPENKAQPHAAGSLSGKPCMFILTQGPRQGKTCDTSACREALKDPSKQQMCGRHFKMIYHRPPPGSSAS